MSADLFAPFTLGDLTLANRMVMAPMTRNRADRSAVVTAMMETYYSQRASAGLIVTESVPVSEQAIGYPLTPCLYNDAQAAGWLRVTDAVHSAGGRIFAQLQHCGRISHPSLQTDNALPVAPSPVRPAGQAVTYTGMQDFVTPRALETNEIPRIVEQFQHGAQMARRAGFDGVEVHGANGYLIDQFLRDGSNQRSDAYGGSVKKRMRLLNEILDAVCAERHARRVGLRLTPENSFNSMSDSDPQAHYEYFATQLSTRDLAYLHVLEGDMMTKASELDYRAIGAKFAGPYIANHGYDLGSAQGGAARRYGRSDCVWHAVPRQSRSGAPLSRQLAAQRGRPGDILWRR